VKTLRKQCAVAILTLTMAVSTYAGILQTPGCTGGGSTTDPLTDVATSLILTVISLVP